MEGPDGGLTLKIGGGLLDFHLMTKITELLGILEKQESLHEQSKLKIIGGGLLLRMQSECLTAEAMSIISVLVAILREKGQSQGDVESLA